MIVPKKILWKSIIVIIMFVAISSIAIDYRMVSPSNYLSAPWEPEGGLKPSDQSSPFNKNLAAPWEPEGGCRPDNLSRDLVA